MSTYKVKDSQALAFHVKIEQLEFDKKGKKLSRPRVQVFGINEWRTVKKSLIQMDFEIEVLHDPTENYDENLNRVKGKHEEAIESETPEVEARKPGRPRNIDTATTEVTESKE